MFTREWLSGDVGIADGRIAGIGAFDGGERLVAPTAPTWCPGFIDAHMHVESSKLTPAEFARAVLPHGTTAIVCDPHEVANVLGSDGVHWMLDASEGLPLTVYVMAPSCVPASAFESPRRALTPGDMEAILRRRRALGVAEMMNFPGVIAGDPEVLEKLEVRGASHADGHAPGVARPRARRLRGSRDPLRPRGDHARGGAREAPARAVGADPRGLQRPQPARAAAAGARVRAGALRVLHRRPRAGLAASARATSTRCAASRSSAGIAAEDALLMATLHGARAHGLEGHGAIAPGYRADLVVLDDLSRFAPSLVLAGGRVAARDGRAEPFDAPEIARPRGAAPCAARRCRAADLALDADGASRVRVIEIVPEQLITIARDARAERCATAASSPTRRATSRRSR